MDVGSWDCHTWWRSNILIYLIITLYHGDNSFLQTSIENETSLSNLTVLLLIFTTFIWIDSTKPIYYLRKQRMVSFIYMPTCDIYALVGKAWADLQIHTYNIHTGLTWWSIAFTSFLKLSIRVEAIPRLSCPSSSTATLHIYVFWGCLERPRKQLCAARNSRLLAACIILPEICSRGFSLRPLFDACWQYWLQGCAGGLLVNSPKSARLRMWPRSPMGVPIHIHVCMKAWPLL